MGDTLSTAEYELQGQEPLLPNMPQIHLRPLSPTSTHVQVLINADPKLAYIPYWLFNFATKTFIHFAFSKFREQVAECCRKGSVYEERIQTDPLYVELRRLLEEKEVKRREKKRRDAPDEENEM